MSKPLPAGFADRFQIVHAIPGRMRIAAPQLSLLAKRHRGVRSLIELIRSRLEKPSDIKRMTFSHITGSIVIEYDPESLDESELLKRLKQTASSVVKQQDDFDSLLVSLREKKA